MKLRNNLHWFICLIFLIGSCAKQTAPTGGPKDTIPPKLVRAVPPNDAINFNGKTVEMLFSEAIQLNNPKEQLIITPSVGKDFEVKTKKNSVAVEFKNDLATNTTYSLNFRETVQDLTEKNPAKNLQLAFSTGPYIDSLSIEGTVSDMIKGRISKDAIVAIHPKNDTFNIFKHPAIIFTKSDDKGRFKIDHLKPDEYFIYAIEDKNKNLFADTKSESYGFLKNLIDLRNDTSKISIKVLRLDARPLKIISARPYNSYFNIRTTKNLNSFQLSTPEKKDIYASFGEDQSNIKIYNTIAEGDSIKINLSLTDSIGNKLDTAVFAKFPKREVTKEKFDLNITSGSILADKGLLKASLKFSKPLKEVNFDSLIFKVDSTTLINLTKDDLTWIEPTNTLTIEKTLDKKLFATPPAEEVKKKLPPEPKTKNEPQIKKLNQLYIGKGAFISIENDSSRKASQTITPAKTEDLSQIIFEFKTTHKNVIVQLLDKNFNTISEIKNKLKGEFNDLPAGDYMVRLILDQNGNGKWDPGNYYQKEEPEPLIYYKDEKGKMLINLKTNWELVLTPMLITY